MQQVNRQSHMFASSIAAVPQVDSLESEASVKRTWQCQCGILSEQIREYKPHFLKKEKAIPSQYWGYKGQWRAWWNPGTRSLVERSCLRWLPSNCDSSHLCSRSSGCSKGQAMGARLVVMPFSHSLTSTSPLTAASYSTRPHLPTAAVPGDGRSSRRPASFS